MNPTIELKSENKTSATVINALHKELASNSVLRKQVLQSLLTAKEKAKKNLDPKLYAAFVWPATIEEYISYLSAFAKWTPNINGDAWKTADGYRLTQEVSDRLNHFYWLIDQVAGETGGRIAREVQNGPWFSKWLVDYANAWGSFLSTTDSFNETILNTFIRYSPEYHIQDSMISDSVTGISRPNAPSGWLTFNQFFARELNPGMRPVDSPSDNTVIVSPADCEYKETFPISAKSTIPEIVLKNTHRFATIKGLLDDSPYKDLFANGTYVHYFLDTFDYHRFHAPVSGKVLECRSVHGLAYIDVIISDKGQYESPDNATDGYEFMQARGILILDTAQSGSQNIGKVAIIPVGMCQVSSVTMKAEVGRNLLKGDEFGYFMFGGSDIIMLFQEGISLELNTLAEHHLHGTPVATCKALS
jgi:phosphatidylserine decarboxylase